MATYDIDSLPSKLKAGDIINCPYKGAQRDITLPKGQYKLECWGAKSIYSSASPSSTYSSGYGGYATGTLTLSNSLQLFLYVGGMPGSSISGGTASYYNGGWNGGGGKASCTSCNDNGPGAGATDICLVSSSVTLSNYRWIRTNASYNSRLLVAGGGGGGRSANDQTNGGYAPVKTTSASYNGGMTSGGTSGDYSSGFGYGSAWDSRSDDCGCGGGGWYGGGSNGDSYGGGGSSFAWCSTYASYVPSGYSVPSTYYLSDVSLLSGLDSMPNPSGGTETGHTGDGYIRITCIKVTSVSLPIKSGGVWKDTDSAYIKTNNTWKEIDSVYIKSNGAWKETG